MVKVDFGFAAAGAAAARIERQGGEEGTGHRIRPVPSKLARHIGWRGVSEVELTEGVRPVRRVPGGRGGQVRLRHPRRGDARPERIPAGLLDHVHPGSPRAGRGLHGRHVRPPDRARRRLPGHARPGRHEPRDRGGRRVPRPLAARRADRPGGPAADAQGVPPAHRRRLDVQADHQVEHPPERGRRDPRGRAQGVQGRPGAQARPDAHRAARGRDGGAGRRGAAARAQHARAGRSRAPASCWPPRS